jgi:LEA14-like dessication related protein
MLFTATVAVTGCAKPKPPTLTPRTAQVVAAGPTGLELSLELEVHNPNSFPLLIHSVDGTLRLAGGAELGRGHAAPEGSIPAEGSKLIGSRLNIGWANLAALAPFVMSDQPVPYTVQGVAKVGGSRLNIDLPFALKGELTRQQLLQAGLAPPTGAPAP